LFLKINLRTHKIENKDKLNDPILKYEIKQQLKFFRSFNEINEADAEKMAALTPIENFQKVTFLLKKIYAEELNKSMNKQIKFKADEKFY